LTAFRFELSFDGIDRFVIERSNSKIRGEAERVGQALDVRQPKVSGFFYPAFFLQPIGESVVHAVPVFDVSLSELLNFSITIAAWRWRNRRRAVSWAGVFSTANGNPVTSASNPIVSLTCFLLLSTANRGGSIPPTVAVSSAGDSLDLHGFSTGFDIFSTEFLTGFPPPIAVGWGE
jgi:hypothetical protein